MASSERRRPSRCHDGSEAPAQENARKSSKAGSERTRGSSDLLDGTATAHTCQDDNPWLQIARRSSIEAPPYPAIFINFWSPGAERLQVQAKSTSIWFPAQMNREVGPGNEYLTQAMRYSPALVTATDASCILQLAQHAGDQRLLMAGRRLYGDALRLLGRETAVPADRRRDGAIIAAINVIQVSDFLTTTGADDASWKYHAAAVAILLQNVRLEEYTKQLQGLINSNTRLFSIWNGLLPRKRSMPSQPMDTKSILSIAQRVPGVLQDCDEVCQAPSLDASSQRVIGTVRALKATEAKLNAWAADWNHNLRDAPYYLTPSERLDFLPSTTQVFPFDFGFEDIIAAQDHATFAASLLVIRRAILDVDRVLAERHAPVERLRAQRQDLVKTTSRCADALLMTVPYLCSAEHGNYGVVCSTRPLSLARAWYRSCEAGKDAGAKMAWCEEVAD